MSISSVNCYLQFGGRCEEALKFYQETLGAELLMLMRFNESPEPPPPGILAPGFENKVMHCSFKINNTMLMASDGCNGEVSLSGFNLSLAIDTPEEAEQIFNSLAAGGSISMPMCKTFWSPAFGMLVDKFGVSWMVNVVPPT